MVWEYSLVSRPAYSGTTLDARQDAVHGEVIARAWELPRYGFEQSQLPSF